MNDTNVDFDSLARFRADPRKVRITVMALGNGDYILKVLRVGSDDVETYAYDRNPTRALVALVQTCKVDGMDPNMERVYEHPWGHEGVKNRAVLPEHEQSDECFEDLSK